MVFKRPLRKENPPVVFVPGLFGSMSDVIIPGTGDWHFGIAGIVYQPFIDLLERELGLIKGENLFTAYYDWRKPIDHSARHYLYETIQQAKKITKQKKVNIICHSMGGLVSRAYVESSYYKKDVNEVIMMCTPNAGSAPNFSYWTGGSLPIHTGEKFNLVRLYMEAYLWILSKLYRTDDITTIHEHFSGLHDIVPGKAYGDYLLHKSSIINSYTFLSYESMNTKNPLIDDLNEKQNKRSKRKINLTLIAGIGKETIKYFEVIPSHSKKAWIDGKVINAIKTEAGDGNATLASVFAINGEKHVVKGSHNEVLFNSLPMIAQKLGIEYRQPNNTFQLDEDYCLLLIHGRGRVELIDKETGDLKKGTFSDVYSIRVNDLTCLFIPQERLTHDKVTFVTMEDEIISYIWMKNEERTENTVKVNAETPFELISYY